MKIKPAEIIRINTEIPKMRSVFFEEHGGPEKLRYAYTETPHPGHHEVLVKVKACGLNHLDLWNLMGMPGLKVSMPHILGCDIAGEVVGLGAKVKGIALNRPVIVAPGISCRKCSFCRTGWDSLCDQYKIIGFQGNGGYAEYACVPAANIIPVSSKYSHEEWAGVGLVSLTAWHMLITRAKLKKKETVLFKRRAAAWAAWPFKSPNGSALLSSPPWAVTRKSNARNPWAPMK